MRRQDRSPAIPMLLLSVEFLLAPTLLVRPAIAQNQSPAQSRPRDSTEGAVLYREHCAVCHGVTGHGDGSMASRLKGSVPDLTRLASSNNGQFPTARVRHTIEGDDADLSHGTRKMPIWGPIFHQVEGDHDYGYVRVENLTRYLESIQR